MVDNARIALWPSRLAVCAGFSRAFGCRAEGLVRGGGEILRRIDRGRAFANFEMQLRRGHVAGLSGMRDHLAALDGVAALNHQLAGMRVSRHKAVGVTDQDQIAVALELIASIS